MQRWEYAATRRLHPQSLWILLLFGVIYQHQFTFKLSLINLFVYCNVGS